jgi:hypothetical protein
MAGQLNHGSDQMKEEEVKFIPLAHFSNSVEAGMVAELLTNNGVRALLRGASFGALEPLLMPGGYSEITLEVAEPDFARAQELYDAFFARPAAEPLDESADGGER